jgi:hypothetical protein
MANVGQEGGAFSEGEREPHPSDSLRTFGAVVQALREHAGLSRVEFGERVRFSKHTVESVELGRRMPDELFVERGEEATGNTGRCGGPRRICRGGRWGWRLGPVSGRGWSGRR